MTDKPEQDPTQLAIDGDRVLEGCEPPTEEEQLKYLKAQGWPT